MKPIALQPLSEMMNQSQEDLEKEILALAQLLLGPASVRCFGDPAAMQHICMRVEAGRNLEDAILHEAFDHSKEDRFIADEFLGHFLTAMMRLGHLNLRPSLRRFLETGDLVQSVLGSLWQDLDAVGFSTRGEFISYLGVRLKWKASDKARGLKAGNRREDRREDQDFHELLSSDAPSGPQTLAALNEERDLLILTLLKLPERDREIMKRYLVGESHQQIADALQIEAQASRKALQRAIEKARQLN